ncbi:MAG: GNAT family N-acetyltransferase [Patescibacteria group bacterium]
MLIKGNRVCLRPLKQGDVGARYLRWMNDPKVQEYTRRRGIRTTLKELQSFVTETKKSKNLYFAILVGKKHIGNLFLYLGKNKSADLSIMIGARNEQGKGYASEAIGAASKFAFDRWGVSSLTAGSANPGFNAVMRKLGWKRTKVKRKGFVLGARRRDVGYWRMVKKTYARRK